MIEDVTKKDIVWNWYDNTDFSSIGGKPIVIEHSSYHDGTVTYDTLIKRVKDLVGTDHTVIEHDGVIVILAKTE